MIKRLFSWWLCALLAAPLALAAQDRPDALIERIGKQLIERIKADPALRSGDLQKLSALVDEIVMPHVDFRRMTALSVGRYWRSATPEQQRELMAEFRTLLLRTYAGALSTVSDQKIRMRPMRAGPQDTDVIVRSEVVQSRGEPIQLDYRMEKTGDGWKAYDVNILGVWLVETYRSQFGQQISAGGIDGLIRSLAEKNRQSAAGRGS